MAEQIILLRHGETGSEYQKRYIGWKDISLAEPGRRNVEALTEMVRLRRPSLCLCSTLRRCRESAEIVAGTLGIPVYFNPTSKRSISAIGKAFPFRNRGSGSGACP